MRRTIREFTIANGAATSNASGDAGAGQLVGLIFPASMTSATMTFTMSTETGGTYVAVMAVEGAAAYSITITSSRYVPLDPRVFAGIDYIKLVANGNETGDKRIKGVYREVQ